MLKLNILLSTYKEGRKYKIPPYVAAIIIALNQVNAKSRDSILNKLLNEEYEKIEPIQYYNLLISANVIEDILLDVELTINEKAIEITNYYNSTNNPSRWNDVFNSCDYNDIPFNTDNIDLLKSFMNFRIIGYSKYKDDIINTQTHECFNKLINITEFEKTQTNLAKVFQTIDISNERYDYLTIFNILEKMYSSIEHTITMMSKLMDIFQKILTDNDFIDKFLANISDDLGEIFNDLVDYVIYDKGTLKKYCEFVGKDNKDVDSVNYDIFIKSLYFPQIE